LPAASINMPAGCVTWVGLATVTPVVDPGANFCMRLLNWSLTYRLPRPSTKTPTGKLSCVAPEPLPPVPATVTPVVEPGANFCTRLLLASATNRLPALSINRSNGLDNCVAPAPEPPVPATVTPVVDPQENFCTRLLF